MREALERAGLSPAELFLDRYPHELSGGQRQRVAIAAALVLEPKLLVADEPVSMLDVSVRAGILDLLDGLRRGGLGILMITHDLSTATQYADRIMVMYLGRIVEEGPAREVVGNPQHPYTRALISVVPRRDPHDRRSRRSSQGETPNPVDIPAGCRFHPRCPIGDDACRAVDPAARARPAATAPPASSCERRSSPTGCRSRGSCSRRPDVPLPLRARDRRAQPPRPLARRSGTTGWRSTRPSSCAALERPWAVADVGAAARDARRGRASRRSSTSTASGATSSSATSTATTARIPGRFVDVLPRRPARHRAPGLRRRGARRRACGARATPARAASRSGRTSASASATTSGALVLPDDERLAPVFAAAGELGLPVLIHTADPVAFFEPVDGEQRAARGADREARVGATTAATSRRSRASCARSRRSSPAHPGTTFIVAHVGCYPENLPGSTAC